MVARTVAGVEPACVVAVEVAHPCREVRHRRFDDQVVVVPHETQSVDAPAIAAADPVQDAEKHVPVVCIGVDRTPIVTTRGDVVEAAGHEAAEGASHRRRG